MISKAHVVVPFGTYAVVRKKGERKDVEAVLMQPKALEVEAVESRHLRPAATVVGLSVSHIAGQNVEETVYAMDGRLFRPIGLDHRSLVRTPLAPDRLVPFFKGDTFLSLPGELPDTLVTPHAMQIDGRWQRPDVIEMDEPGLRIIQDPDAVEASGRLARLQRRLLVVDGEVWTECPAPRLSAQDRYYQVQVIPSCGVFSAMTGHAGISTLGFQFPLDRIEDATRCLDIVDPDGAPPRPRDPPRFEIHDRDAIAFDGAAASAFHAGPSVERELARYVAGFSDDGMDAYMQIRSAVRRMRETDEGPVPMRYGHPEDTAIFHEACGRAGADEGFRRAVGSDLAEPMPEWVRNACAHLGRRYRELETGDVPDLALEAPRP